MNRVSVRAICVLAAIVLFGSAVVAAAEDWPQWGGPSRDFTLKARELSKDWGDSGPPLLWTRPLGGGFSAIVSDGRRLYTMYREGDEEVVVALDPRSGKTRWEHRYIAPVPVSESLSTDFGKGPNGTPLLVDGKLVTIGFTGHVRCLDKAKGKLKWSKDLGLDFGVKIPYFGHSTSPIAIGDDVVIVAGGLLSFDLETGKVRWRNRDFEGSYGSPRLVDAGGRQQIITPVAGHLAGFDPETGRTLWSHEHKNQWGTILTSPVFDEAGRVFVSAAQVGSALIDPAAEGEGSRKVWLEDDTQIAHSNAIRDGKWLFASVGDSASFMTATSLEDGKQAWKERGFARANLLRVGDDYLLLDFEAQLAMVRLGSEGMEILTQTSIGDERTWTPPTLIGDTLFIRDEARILALDLSAE